MSNNTPRITAHAVTRMAQRGFASNDLELIQWIGTEVEDGYFVREKDFQALDQNLKILRNQARKLVGKRLVVCDNQIVTVYHANRGKEHRLLRDTEDQSLKN